MKKPPVHGRYTQVDIGGTSSFFNPWAPDPFGMLRPQMDLDALRLSMELAASSYDLNIDQFLNAGWTDISVQAETRLFTGMNRPAPNLDTKEKVKSNWGFFRSRRDATSTNPISQVRGMLRQFKVSESGKVLVMAKKQDDSHYVIAIGFMGTSGKVADWFANFRMTTEGGFHKGFYQLARQFESNENKILFPDIASDLGLEALTLSDILRECTKQDSRFQLWMAGHSQGGAVMQVYTHFKIQEDTLNPHTIVGYGFASPSCALANEQVDPGAYPLFHVLNSDDFVPHMGSQVHFGLMMTYPATKTIRENCYTWPTDEQSVALRAKLRRITNRMVDTPACMETSLAYIETLLKHPADEITSALSQLNIRFVPIKSLISFTNQKDYDIIRFLRRQVNVAYTELTGAPMDGDKLIAIQKQLEPLVEAIGITKLSAALSNLMLNPHHLVASKGAMYGSYQYIVNKGTHRLQYSVWSKGKFPERIWYDGHEQEESAAQAPGLLVRRNPKAPKRSPKNNKGITGYSSSRRMNSKKTL